MSENAGIEQGQQVSQGQPQNVGTGQQAPNTENVGQQQQGGKPYDQYLQRIPESLRPTVQPIFDEWDANTTRRFQDLNGQISQYQPYQEYFDQYEAEAIGQAIQLAESLSSEEGARALYEQLTQMFGQQGNGQQTPNGQQQQNGFGEIDDDPVGARLTALEQKIEQQLGSFAQNFQQMQQQQQEEQTQQQVASEWQSAVEKNKDILTDPQTGQIDPNLHDMALSIAINMTNGDIDKAFQQFRTVIGKQASVQNAPGQNAPLVGGGAQNNMPTNVVDVAKWSPEQKKQAAIAALRANNQQR